jgi:hypothetical protein
MFILQPHHCLEADNWATVNQLLLNKEEASVAEEAGYPILVV